MVTKPVTALKVTPSDWLTNPSSVNKPWQIWYRYNGTLVKVQGMNREKKYSERVKCTIELLKEEETKLFQYGYNPITKTYLRLPERATDQSEIPQAGKGLMDSLSLAIEHLDVERPTQICVKSCLKYIADSSVKIGIDRLPVDQIRKRHIKLLMNHCSEERKLSPRSWNSYRAYLMMLFEQLVELELVDHNPVRELKKKRETIQLRQTLTNEERERVKSHLKQNHPDFYRFVQIFFHSGSRRTELLSLKVNDVDLVKGEYITLVKKGQRKRHVIRVIKNIARSFWEQLLQGAKADHYVFSEGLVPGPRRIRVEQVSRRWKRLVKDKLGITADLYSLKHLNTDETASLLDIEAAAKHNSHTTSQITKKHYAFGEDARLREKLKNVSNEF